MKKVRLNKERAIVALVIVVFSLLLVTPQLFSQDVILGSDAIFHYNRFYEAAMQIKEENYSYFISLYGFQQSGRIVNALYGPFFAYFQGLLILISGTWFRYQILSRFLLHLLAASSMYALLRQCKVRLSLSLALGIFYVTTFSIQYWTMRQGFSSWGAALLPYCFIPAIRYIFTRHIEPIRLGASLALVFQVHVLSAVMLVMMYLPFYLYTFVKSQPQEKKQAIKNVLLAAGLFMVLTVNVWIILLYLRGRNHLLDPFINKTIGQNGVDGTANYWLSTPSPLSLLLIVQLIYTVVAWRKMANWKRILCCVYYLFFFLSTGLFPWQTLLDKGNNFAELIQFPFRFFVPATILLLVLTGLMLNRVIKWQRLIMGCLFLLPVIGLVENVQATSNRVHQARMDQEMIPLVKHTYVKDDYQTIRQAVHSTNLSTFLQLVVKSTPDYVPIYGKIGSQNTYRLYYSYIIDGFTVKKVVRGKQLILTWQAEDRQTVNLPVVKYQDTSLQLNGQTLTSSDYQLTTIGTPKVTSRQGKNKLVLTYHQPEWFSVVIVVVLISWLMLPLQHLYKYYKR